jgi:hypothetical protein
LGSSRCRCPLECFSFSLREYEIEIVLVNKANGSNVMVFLRSGMSCGKTVIGRVAVKAITNTIFLIL